jgi:hypothetical protein
VRTPPKIITRLISVESGAVTKIRKCLLLLCAPPEVFHLIYSFSFVPILQRNPQIFFLDSFYTFTEKIDIKDRLSKIYLVKLYSVCLALVNEQAFSGVNNYRLDNFQVKIMLNICKNLNYRYKRAVNLVDRLAVLAIIISR